MEHIEATGPGGKPDNIVDLGEWRQRQEVLSRLETLENMELAAQIVESLEPRTPAFLMHEALRDSGNPGQVPTNDVGG